MEPQQPVIEETQERLAEEPVVFELASAIKPNPDIMSRLIQDSPVDHDFQEDAQHRLTKTSAFLSMYRSIDSFNPSA